MNKKFLYSPLSIKSIGENGVFSGYASVFNIVDKQNDLILPGAFKENLNRNKIKLLWQHNPDEPIGIALFTIIRTDRNMLLACYSHKHISYRIRTIIRKAITLENTGKYELGLAHFLVDKDIAVHRANTRKVKSFVLSHGTLAKSDQSDARALAQYGFERYSTLSLFAPMSKEQTTLVALCQRRDDITKMRAQEKSRLAAPENDHIKESCQKTIEFFNSQIDELNNTIQKIIDENPELQKRQKILKTVPGIGAKLSQDFLCLMPELGYVSRGEIASLAGVASHPKESGKTIGYRRISGGRSNVREKLFTAAMSASRSKSALGAFYSRLVGKGKKKMVAMTALMRKIIV